VGWKEENSYELVSSRESLPFSLSFFSITPCDLAEAKTVLANMHYRVRVGSTPPHNFLGADPRFQDPGFDVTAAWTEGGFSLVHQRGELRLSFAHSVTLTGRETAISISEASLTLKDDHDYTKFNTEVVRGVKFYFKLPPSCRFTPSACACCLTAYELQGGVAGSERITFEDGGRTAVLDSDSWMLPGVAFTLGWKPWP